jgi:glycosyltransferase involved in cell wall biosynthesis
MSERPLDIAVIAAFDATYIQDDIRMLRRKHRVRVQIGHGPAALLKVIWMSLRSDVVFCWFASVYGSVAVIIASMLGTRSLLVIGGVDVAKEEGLGYGQWRSGWRGRLTGAALRRAGAVLAVDPSLKDEAMHRAAYDGRNIHYVPTGYDPEFWKPVGSRQPHILTVALVNEEARLKVKGIDLLLTCAKRLPAVTFILIGVSRSLFTTGQIPGNVKLYPAMTRNELLPFYQSAGVYCQPSRREGLPNTLCEAMLCGCFPVVSNAGGNVTAVGDTGTIVTAGDTDALTRALSEALQQIDEAAPRSRARIVSLFPLEKRERAILRFLGENV